MGIFQNLRESATYQRIVSAHLSLPETCSEMMVSSLALPDFCSDSPEWWLFSLEVVQSSSNPMRRQTNETLVQQHAQSPTWHVTVAAVLNCHNPYV